MDRFKQYRDQKVKECPWHKEEIDDLLELAQMEVEEGGSEEHEYSLFVGSVEDLISG